MRQPDFHGAGHRSLLGAESLQSFRPGGLARRDMAKDEVAVTGEGFAIAGDREIRAKFQGSLTQNGSSGVVYCHERTALVSGSNEFGEITHIQPWIARCFQPQQRCSI